jgi:hypothetical protein
VGMAGLMVMPACATQSVLWGGEEDGWSRGARRERVRGGGGAPVNAGQATNGTHKKPFSLQ